MGKYPGVITLSREYMEFYGAYDCLEYKIIRAWSELEVALPKCVSMRRRQQVIFPNGSQGFVVINKLIEDNRYLLKGLT